MSDILRFPPPSAGQKPGNRKQQSEADITRRRALDIACAESRRRLMGFPASEISVDRLVLIGTRSATLLCPPLAAAGGHMLVRFLDGRHEARWLPTGLAPHPGAPGGPLNGRAA